MKSYLRAFYGIIFSNDGWQFVQRLRELLARLPVSVCISLVGCTAMGEPFRQQ
jgi:hypothetical protein